MKPQGMVQLAEVLTPDTVSLNLFSCSLSQEDSRYIELTSISFMQLLPENMPTRFAHTLYYARVLDRITSH